MITQEEALYTLSQHYDLSLVYELEPANTARLVELALTCDNPDWRRADFELMKLFVAPIAGKAARHSLLRTNRHEEALLAFIDWLLDENAQEDRAG